MASTAKARSDELAQSSLSSASSLMALQFLSRLLTFALNQVLFRLAPPQAFGTAAIQFELLLSTILFLSREGVRNALLRASWTLTSVKNVACVPLMVGIPLAAMTAWVYGGYLATLETSVQPGFVAAITVYALAAVVELSSEPLHNRAISELKTGVRIRAEGAGVMSKTLVTLVMLLLDDGAGGLALLAFAAGQVGYAISVLLTYFVHYGYVPLWPRRSKEEALFDRGTLRLSLTMTSQSLVKHFLTEGDKFVLSSLSPLQDQGGYAIAVNYGSLIARIVFQPIEETARVFFSKLLLGPTPSRAALQQAADSFLSLLAIQASFTAILLTFGPAYVPIALSVLLPPRYLSTSAPSVLAAWVWYIPVLAVNGALEAFLSSVATSKDLNRQSRWMIAFSVIYIGTALALYTAGLGDTSLVYANIFNLSARIFYCWHFVQSYFTAREARELLRWRDVIPRRPVLLATTSSYALVYYSDKILGVRAALEAHGRRALFTVPVLMHVSLGGALALTCLAVWWRSSGRFLTYLKRVKER